MSALPLGARVVNEWMNANSIEVNSMKFCRKLFLSQHRKKKHEAKIKHVPKQDIQAGHKHLKMQPVKYHSDKHHPWCKLYWRTASNISIITSPANQLLRMSWVFYACCRHIGHECVLAATDVFYLWPLWKNDRCLYQICHFRIVFSPPMHARKLFYLWVCDRFMILQRSM